MSLFKQQNKESLISKIRRLETINTKLEIEKTKLEKQLKFYINQEHNISKIAKKCNELSIENTELKQRLSEISKIAKRP
jgi:regulator of replication initiation timing